jgi:hypothetical protein
MRLTAAPGNVLRRDGRWAEGAFIIVPALP